MFLSRVRTGLVLVSVLLLIGAVAAPCVGAEQAPEEKDSGPLLPPRITADDGIWFYRSMFAMPVSYGDDYNGQETEFLFQLSLKLQVVNTRFYFAYTQKCFWQLYNVPASSPFRETNYLPEIIYRVTPENSNLKNWGYDIALEHESNGQGPERSRSWNRLYFASQYRWKKAAVYGKVWYRFKEDSCPVDGPNVDCDNNPDIQDYLGRTEFHGYFQLTEGEKPQKMHVMLGGNLNTGKLRMSVDYMYPAKSQYLYWFAKAYYGYGESLIDHDRSIARIGIGLALSP